MPAGTPVMTSPEAGARVPATDLGGFFPPLGNCPRIVAPLRDSSRTIFEQGIVAAVDPTVEEVDANWTYFDSQGILQDAILNEARIGADGMRFDATRTNKFLQARQFDTTWTLQSGLAIAQDAIGVDGVANKAWTLTDDGGATEHLRQEVTVANDSTKWTAYIHVRKLGSAPSSFPRVVLNLVNGTLQSAQYRIDPQTGATHEYSVTGAASVNVKSVGNWWRLEITLANNNTGNTLMRCNIIPADSATLTGAASAAVTGALVIDAAQLENADLASSFIDTTTSAVIALADALQYASAGNLIGGGDFTIIFAATPDFNEADIGVSANMFTPIATGPTRGIQFEYRSSSSQVECGIWNAGSKQAELVATTNLVRGIKNVWAVTCKINEARLYADGVEEDNDTTSVALPSSWPSDIFIGQDWNGNVPWIGKLAHLIIYNRALDAAEIATVTAEIDSWMG